VPGVLVSSLAGGAKALPSASAESLPLDVGALKQVLANLPEPLPPTAPDGTRVGTETGVDPSAAPVVPTSTGGVPMVSVQPDLNASNAGSERDLRATLYFALVNQCRDASGKHLPPEAIEIDFRVDARGYIDRSSVKARATDAAYDEAARCMVRVIRTSEARFAPARLDEPTQIRATLPSVD
jgi:hypothetical protein